MSRYMERSAGRIADAIVGLRRARGDTGLVCPLPHIPPGALWWPLANIWLGASIEDRIRKSRMDLLRDTPAASRFLSIEPLLEDVGVLDLRGIDWVIIGGESGPGARTLDLAWARQIIAQCREAGVACFIKQLGRTPIENGEPLRLDDRKGADMAEWPEDLRVRQFPRTVA